MYGMRVCMCVCRCVWLARIFICFLLLLFSFHSLGSLVIYNSFCCYCSCYYFLCALNQQQLLRKALHKHTFTYVHTYTHMSAYAHGCMYLFLLLPLEMFIFHLFAATFTFAYCGGILLVLLLLLLLSVFISSYPFYCFICM